MSLGIVFRIGNAGSLPFVVDGISLAPLAAEGSEFGHLTLAPHKSAKVSARGIRRSHHFTGVIHPLRTIPEQAASRRSQRAEVGHHSVAVEKWMIAAICGDG